MSNVYNEVGQLRTKRLHSTDGNTFSQPVTYSYNARGWLTAATSAHFSQYLKYADNIAGVVNQYNGNISRQEWKHGNAATQAYHYRYDNLNRLNAGNMPNGQFREALQYDRMGNITRLGRTADSNVLVDTLVYTYSGNHLASVVDNSGNTNAAYQLPGTTNYAHDANGNMLSRINSGSTANNISSITYNHLNLPHSVTAVADNAAYAYDATGRKLRSVLGA